MAKKQYSIFEAKKSLPKLIQQALSGEEIIITKRRVPLVRLATIKPTKIKLGRYKGRVKIADNFGAPLDDFSEYMKRNTFMS